jgi:phospholipid/cholesterol/gamma-HCH transport system substrate-binding protein
MTGLRRPLRALVALGVLAAVTAGVVVSVKAANGDFAGDYRLTGYFPRAGEGLVPGSEVVYRGVQVGRVASVSLAGTSAKVTLVLPPSFRVPSDATATIEPVNLFGAEQVSITAPGGGPSTGPYLAATGRFIHTATSDELGALFAAAAPLLKQINTNDLATVIGELAQASNGEGPQIAQGIDAGAHLAAYFDQTLAAQLAALDSFSRFTAALAPDGAVLNGLSRQENAALPTFNQDAADYRTLLVNLTDFSNVLARLLTDYHPTLVTLLTDGDNVARVLIAQQTELGQVIRGSYQYAMKVAGGESAAVLPNGSHFAYFNTFVLFTDVNTLVCNLLAPAQPGLAFLEPLQQALAGASSPFTCKAELAAFNAAQGAPTASAATPAAPASATGAAKALQTLGTQVYGIAGRPTRSRPQSLGGYVGSILGGGGAG